MTASAETVLPEPLSPTRPSVLPGCTAKLTSSMTGSHSPLTLNSTRRRSTARSGADLRRDAGAGRSGCRGVVPSPVTAGLEVAASGVDPVRASRPRRHRRAAAARRPLAAQRVPQAVGDQIEGQHRQHDGDPGKMTAQGGGVDELEALLSMPPQLGVGGCSPMPRKLRPASVRSAKPSARAS